MIIVASAEKAAATRKQTKPGGMLPVGTMNWRTGFIGPSRHELAKGAPMPGPGELFPSAFMIEQPPHGTLRPHFHVPHQFQVVTGGSGTLGRHPISYGSVHYTAPFTAYGPIADKGEGVAYMTLRNGWDSGAQYMPEARDALRAANGGHREREADPGPHLSDAELAAVREGLSLVMIPPEDDGLGAWFHRVPAGEAVTGPSPGISGGQYWMVMGGALDNEGELLTRLSCVFVSPDEAPFTANAGPGGLEVLALQFPVQVVQVKH